MNTKDTWNHDFKDLSHRAKKYYSQYGEDALIDAIFEICPPQNKWCVEVGAGDGVTISNTAYFIQSGWKAILIESIYEKLRGGRLVGGLRKVAEIWRKNSNVFPVHATLTRDNLDRILSRFPIPKDFDFLSLDIDSFDLEVWKNLNYRPNLVCIECNDEPRSLTDNFYEPGNRHNGASVVALKELGHEKGYDFVCATYCNCIFIEREFGRKLKK